MKKQGFNLDNINKKFDKIQKILDFKNLCNKLSIINKILKYDKEKKKSLYKIVELPKGGGRILEVEFPDGQKQVVQLKSKSNIVNNQKV